MSKLVFKEYYRNNLPHIQYEGVKIAVTFRLAFSLPQNILNILKREKDEYIRISSTLKETEKEACDIEFNRKYFENFDQFIDKYKNESCWLKLPKVADIVYKSLIFLNNRKYILHCFTIMPNHIHMIIEPLKNNERIFGLSEIMQSLKGYTAKKCNEILLRKGQFWQHGHYDHLIRDARDYNYQVYYLINNPVKAGLVNIWKDWEYTYVDQTFQFD